MEPPETQDPKGCSHVCLDLLLFSINRRSSTKRFWIWLLAAAIKTVTVTASCDCSNTAVMLEMQM